MIYLPKHFKEERFDLVRKIIDEYNFATLITVRDHLPVVSHLPFLFVPTKDNHGTFVAHMAKANPQWRSFRSNSEALVVFNGPHAYVSPSWYQRRPDNVPTWNYASIHVHGIPKIFNVEQEANAAMEALVKRHDPDLELMLSDKDRKEMMAEVVVFEISVSKIEAKFKLSQNRSENDQASVADHLEVGGDHERQIAALMKELNRRSPLVGLE